MKTPTVVAVYLAAIVAANLFVAAFGPVATIPAAFLLIGFDLSARDTLHQAWEGRGLWPRMALLIGVGSLLSWLLNRDAAQIALASSIAFAAAGLIDAATFALLRSKAHLLRVNGSNVTSALVDSVLFPTIAFGAIFPEVIAGQFAAKVLGGAIWAYLIFVVMRRRLAQINRPV